MEWGCVPKHLLSQVSMWTDPLEQEKALRELVGVFRDLQTPDPVVKNVGTILEVFSPLVSCDSANVAELAINTLTAVITLVRVAVVPHFSVLIGSVVKAWGDSRAAVRLAATRCLYSTYTCGCPHGEVISFLLRKIEAYDELHIREEAVNFVVYCLLTERDKRAQTQLKKAILPLLHSSLLDPRPRIEFAAVEGYASLKSIFGSAVLSDIACLRTTGHDDLHELLLDRFSETMLPIPGRNGELIHPMLRGASVEKPGESYQAKDMHLSSVPEEEKIKLWLPAPTPEDTNRALRYSNATPGDLELVSLSSAASSVQDSVSLAKRRASAGSGPSPLSREVVCRSTLEPTLSSAGSILETSSLSSNSDKLSLLRAKGRGRRRLLSSSVGSGTDCTPTSSQGPSPTCGGEQSIEQTNFNYASLPSQGTDPLSGAKSGQPGNSAQPPLARRVSDKVKRRPPLHNGGEKKEDTLVLTGTSQNGRHKGVMEQNARPVEEVETEDLKPLKSPEKNLSDALQWLVGNDWMKHLEGLNRVRAAAVHHPQVLTLTLQQTLGLLAGSTDNLRSTISKTAVVAIGNILEAAKKNCDQSLDQVISQLIRRTTDNNHFIVEQAERTLMLAIQHCSKNRTLTCLLNTAGHKSDKQRAKAAKFLHCCCQRIGPPVYCTRDICRLLVTLNKFLGEGSFELRHWGRQCLLVLHASAQEGEFEKVCMKAGLGGKQVEKILEVIHKAQLQQEVAENEQVKEMLTKKVNMSVGGMPALGTRGSLGRKSMEEARRSGQESVLGCVLLGLCDADWKMRIEKLNKLKEMVLLKGDIGEELSSCGGRILDALLSRCLDQNQKVMAVALQILTDMLPLLGAQLTPGSVNKILMALSTPLSSTSSAVVKETHKALASLCETLDCVVFLVSLSVALCHTTHYRVKVAFLKHLYALMEPVHAKNPGVLTTYLLPPCFRFLQDPRSDVRLETNKLITKCHTLIGNDMLVSAKGLPPLQAQRLNDLLED